jgi:hypothetical protein
VCAIFNETISKKLIITITRRGSHHLCVVFQHISRMSSSRSGSDTPRSTQSQKSCASSHVVITPSTRGACSDVVVVDLHVPSGGRRSRVRSVASADTDTSTNLDSILQDPKMLTRRSLMRRTKDALVQLLLSMASTDEQTSDRVATVQRVLFSAEQTMQQQRKDLQDVQELLRQKEQQLVQLTQDRIQEQSEHACAMGQLREELMLKEAKLDEAHAALLNITHDCAGRKIDADDQTDGVGLISPTLQSEEVAEGVQHVECDRCPQSCGAQIKSLMHDDVHLHGKLMEQEKVIASQKQDIIALRNIITTEKRRVDQLRAHHGVEFPPSPRDAGTDVGSPWRQRIFHAAGFRVVPIAAQRHTVPHRTCFKVAT